MGFKLLGAHGLQLACSRTAPSRLLPTAGVPIGYIVAAAMPTPLADQYRGCSEEIAAAGSRRSGECSLVSTLRRFRLRPFCADAN